MEYVDWRICTRANTVGDNVFWAVIILWSGRAWMLEQAKGICDLSWQNEATVHSVCKTGATLHQRNDVFGQNSRRYLIKPEVG